MNKLSSPFKERVKWLYPWIIILVFISYGLVKVPPKYSFSSDSLIKVIQAQSLLENNFQSENLHYAFRDIDPDYKFYPADLHIYHLHFNGHHIGPFGVIFSAITSPFLVLLKYEYLPLISTLIMFLILLSLRRWWQISNYVLLLTAMGTSLIIYGLEFSENILFIAMAYISFSIILRERLFKSTNIQAISAGLLLGFSIWFRLESLLFFGAFFISWLLIFGWRDRNKMQTLLIFSTSFTFAVLLFLIFNYFNYGNILGPKYLADQENFYQSITEKLKLYLYIWFFRIESGFPKVGFFGLTPLFFVSLLIGFIPRFYKTMKPSEKILLITVTILLLLVPITAPHDGRWSWGARYLSLAILPFSIISNSILNNINFSEKYKIIAKRSLLTILFIHSFFFALLGIELLSKSAETMRNVQKDMSQFQADIRLFDSEILAMHTGTQLLSHPTMLARDTDTLREAISLLKKHHSGKILAYTECSLLDALLAQGGKKNSADKNKYDAELKSNLTFIEKKVLPHYEVSMSFYKIP